MKSRTEQLENRGYIADGLENDYYDTSFEQRLRLLKSDLPTDRTLGARLLAKYSDLSSVDVLINALIIEKKLYAKIEICNSLVTFGNDVIFPLIELMGKIGNNQHKRILNSKFKKDSYPLPRDIASRTIIRIGTKALPDLLKVLDSEDITQLSEVIDAIGFICFYEYQSEIFEQLKNCFYRYSENDLIKWKIIRAMSAFSESESFLNEQKQQLGNKNMEPEIERSLSLIFKRTREMSV